MGRASTFEQKAFLLLACKLGIHFFDTAQQYSPGEEILGSTTPKRCQIITKIGLNHSLPSNLSFRDRWEVHFPANVLQVQLKASLERLRRENCHGVLLHSVSDNFDFTSHIRELQKLKALGLVDKIGFSVDATENLPLQTEWADIVQIHVSHLNNVYLRPHQILMVNGIFRSSAEKTFLEFCRKNPKIPAMMILGTHRFSRIIMQILKYRVLSHRLLGGHEV